MLEFCSSEVSIQNDDQLWSLVHFEPQCCQCSFSVVCLTRGLACIHPLAQDVYGLCELCAVCRVNSHWPFSFIWRASWSFSAWDCAASTSCSASHMALLLELGSESSPELTTLVPLFRNKRIPSSFCYLAGQSLSFWVMLISLSFYMWQFVTPDILT